MSVANLIFHTFAQWILLPGSSGNFCCEFIFSYLCTMDFITRVIRQFLLRIYFFIPLHNGFYYQGHQAIFVANLFFHTFAQWILLPGSSGNVCFEVNFSYLCTMDFITRVIRQFLLRIYFFIPLHNGFYYQGHQAMSVSKLIFHTFAQWILLPGSSGNVCCEVNFSYIKFLNDNFAAASTPVNPYQLLSLNSC